ncbi:MAG: hypothetical protein ABI411_03245 [Tahibacter sp.]
MRQQQHPQCVANRVEEAHSQMCRAGDDVNGGVIERIDPERVMRHSGGTLQPVKIPRIEHAAVATE